MKFAYLLATAAGALAHGDDHDDHVHDHRECGTEHDDYEAAQSERIAAAAVAKVCSHANLTHVHVCQPYEVRVNQPVTIPVWYHVIHSGNTGLLTAQQIQAQFDQTNLDFSGRENPSIPGAVAMDITFSFAGSTFTDNAQWFSDIDRYETQIKNAVAVDNRNNFNQYFGNFGAGLLGFCYFPNSFAESSNMHGCMNLYSSIPGGSSTNYNQGKTTTHETGHGIGLFHTFQGGCNGGDQVADTCNQASPTNGCPSSRDSCGRGCPDPINNYMDYSFDRCMTQFTAGQNQRANQQLFTFRPGLYNTDEEQAAINKFLPELYDEAQKFSAAAEAKYMAKRLAKGY